LKTWMFGAVLLLCSASAQATVRYWIDLTAPDHHTGIVTTDFPVTDGPYLDVKMAAWRTGRYTIMNLANGVSQFAATDAGGKSLPWEKIDKSTWRIRLGNPTAVHVRYELYANELGSRTRHIDDGRECARTGCRAC